MVIGGDETLSWLRSSGRSFGGPAHPACVQNLACGISDSERMVAKATAVASWSMHAFIVTHAIKIQYFAFSLFLVCFFGEDSYFFARALQMCEFVSLEIKSHVQMHIYIRSEGLSGHLSMFWNDIMNSVWIGGRGDGGLHE